MNIVITVVYREANILLGISSSVYWRPKLYNGVFRRRDIKLALPAAAVER